MNDRMQTNVTCVYAAGDVCCACWKPADHWIQVKWDKIIFLYTELR